MPNFVVYCFDGLSSSSSSSCVSHCWRVDTKVVEMETCAEEKNKVKRKKNNNNNRCDIVLYSHFIWTVKFLDFVDDWGIALLSFLFTVRTPVACELLECHLNLIRERERKIEAPSIITSGMHSNAPVIMDASGNLLHKNLSLVARNIHRFSSSLHQFLSHEKCMASNHHNLGSNSYASQMQRIDF